MNRVSSSGGGGGGEASPPKEREEREGEREREGYYTQHYLDTYGLLLHVALLEDDWSSLVLPQIYPLLL